MRPYSIGMTVLAAILFCSTGNLYARPVARPISPQTAEKEVVLSFEGQIDGSEKIEITRSHAHWTHLNWGWPPKSVLLGDIRWNPIEQGSLVNDGPTRFVPPVDFSSARLRKIEGRDTVVLEPRQDSLVVHLDDTPNGASMYKFEIHLKRPRPPVQLRVVVDIDGSDQLHLDAAGARWIHRHWSWPKEVRLNRVSWDPRKSQLLKNAGQTGFLQGPIDFATAKLTVNKGRDMVVLEHTKNGLIVHFADNPLGKATYDLTISFEEST